MDESVVHLYSTLYTFSYSLPRTLAPWLLYISSWRVGVHPDDADVEEPRSKKSSIARWAESEKNIMAAHRAASSALAYRLATTFGVSADDLVDEKEVEQIERTTKLILAKLIGLAEEHSTSDTLAVLQAIEAGIDSLLGMTPQQARRYLKAVNDGEDATVPGIGSANTNGHQPLALGSSTASTAPTNPLVDSFAQTVASGDNLTVLAIGYVLDPANRDWNVVDDGTGQPVLASVNRLNTELDNLRRSTRTPRPDRRANEALLQTLRRTIASVRELQAGIDLDSDTRFYDLRPGVDLDDAPMGPDPDQVNDMERGIRAALNGTTSR